MELLYLYLHEYKNFKKQGFCLCSEFQVETKKSAIGIEIVIKKNPNYISGFFGSYIENVSGIIGQNGTGKSNLLDFIRSSLPDGVGGFATECVVAFKFYDNDEGKLVYRLFLTPNVGIKLTDTTNLFEIETHDILDVTEYFQSKYSISEFKAASFIYYSNIVDLKVPSNLTVSKLEGEEETISTNGFYNISTMSLLAKDQENYSNDPKIRIEKLDAFKAREFGRNIEFITSDYVDILDFRLPENLFITLMNEDEKALRNQKKYSELFDKIKRYDDDFNLEKTFESQLFYNNLLKAVLFNLFRTDLQYSSIQVSEQYIYSASGENFQEYFYNFLDLLKTASYQEANVIYLQKKAESIKEFVDFVFEYLIKNNSNLIVYEEALLSIPVNFNGVFNIQKFIDLYIKTKNLTDFLNFKWRSLSSGEQSMLTLISRFYKLRQDFRAEKNKDPLIILLDEPDIYFHPEWQRKLISQLLSYIPKLFPEQKIQLIITANTPYIVSDILNYSVVLLRKVEKETVSTNAADLGKYTFASNIHTLLSDDFYVSSFLGEFAKIKIEQLIAFIKKPESSDYFNEESAQRTIDQIGESVIRNRVQDLFNDKFRNNRRRLAEQREKLRQQLEELDNFLDEENIDV